MTTRRTIAVVLYGLAMLVILFSLPDAFGVNGRRFPMVLLAIPMALTADRLWKR